MIERLIEEGDEDALMVSEFESTANEILQEDPHLFSAYTEARRKLSEKFRFRGFFPMSKGKGKPGGEGWGKESTIGSKVVIGSLWISESWDHNAAGVCSLDECPQTKSGDGQSSVGSTSGSQVPNSFTGWTITAVPNSLPLEFLDLQELVRHDIHWYPRCVSGAQSGELSGVWCKFMYGKCFQRIHQ